MLKQTLSQQKKHISTGPHINNKNNDNDSNNNNNNKKRPFMYRHSRYEIRRAWDLVINTGMVLSYFYNSNPMRHLIFIMVIPSDGIFILRWHLVFWHGFQFSLYLTLSHGEIEKVIFSRTLGLNEQMHDICMMYFIIHMQNNQLNFETLSHLPYRWRGHMAWFKHRAELMPEHL